MKTFTTIAFAILFLICCNAQTAPYTNMTAAQIKASPQVQAVVQAGLAQVIALGQAKNQFNSTNFTVVQVNNAARQGANKGNNYKLNVHYVNTKNESVHAKFTGFYNTTTGQASVSALTYTVQYPKKTTTIKPPTTTPPSTTTPNTTSVSVKQLNTDSFIKGLFDFGFSTTIGLGIKNGSIPNGKYASSKVNSITKQDVKNGAVYTFNVLAKSAANTTVALAFIVRGQLDAYSWKVSK